jgi:hypothetical protein
MKAKKEPFLQSAISKLNFYRNQIGKKLPKNRKKLLELTKEELRILFGRN